MAGLRQRVLSPHTSAPRLDSLYPFGLVLATHQKQQTVGDKLPGREEGEDEVRQMPSDRRLNSTCSRKHVVKVLGII